MKDLDYNQDMVMRFLYGGDTPRFFDGALRDVYVSKKALDWAIENGYAETKDGIVHISLRGESEYRAYLNDRGTR